MEHWLDEKFESLKKIEKTDQEKVNLTTDKIKANFNKNRNSIESFIKKLKELFNKLTMVKEEGFEYYSEYRSKDNEPALNEYIFYAENHTQHPTFLRRTEISVSEEEDKMNIKMFRGKRDSNEKPWKYHDDQEILTDIQKLNEEKAYELIDWFAWQIYTPRSLR